MDLRKAVSKDVKGIAKVHVDSWKTTYKGIVPDKFLQNLSYEEREKMWQQAVSRGDVYVVENDTGRIIGFASGGKERSGNYPEYKSEIYAIYLLEECQGKGVGKLLMERVVRDLLKQNISTMIVIVLEKNKARCFYEALGAKQIDSMEVEIGGETLTELVYGWKNIKEIIK